MPNSRSRVLCGLLVLAATAAGIASRSHAAANLPEFIRLYAGDTFWAYAAFFLVGSAFPRHKTRTLALSAMLLACGVEVSQLYRAEWIDAARDTRLGGLVLGHGFGWTDISCYAAGVLLAALTDVVLSVRRRVTFG